MESMWKTLGSWLLLLGLVIAVLVGLIFGADTTVKDNYQNYAGAILAILGFVIGLLSFFAISNITQEKIPMFLIGALILVILATTASTWTIGWGTIQPYFTNIVTYLAVFAAPAAVLLSIRALWDAGKTKELLPK
jgi:small basic protein